MSEENQEQIDYWNNRWQDVDGVTRKNRSVASPVFTRGIAVAEIKPNEKYWTSAAAAVPLA